MLACRRAVICFGIMQAACAAPIEQSSLQQMSLDTVVALQPSPPSVGQAHLPKLVRYVKEGDWAPSCAIVNGENQDRVFVLVSPEPGSGLPACAGELTEPVVVKAAESVYAVYSYLVEDPRQEFTQRSSFVRLTGGEVEMCSNDAALSRLFQTRKNFKGAEQALMDSILRLGCEIEQTSASSP